MPMFDPEDDGAIPPLILLLVYPGMSAEDDDLTHRYNCVYTNEDGKIRYIDYIAPSWDKAENWFKKWTEKLGYARMMMGAVIDSAIDDPNIDADDFDEDSPVGMISLEETCLGSMIILTKARFVKSAGSEENEHEICEVIAPTKEMALAALMNKMHLERGKDYMGVSLHRTYLAG